jgi:uncharacterized protein (UPF0210 family)
MMDRREFIRLLSANLAIPGAVLAAERLPFRIRTITAGVPLTSHHWPEQLRQAAEFLAEARAVFQNQGYEVQTLRISTPPLPEYLEDWSGSKGLAFLGEMDDFCLQQDLVLSIGPVLNADQYAPDLADWAAELIRNTRQTNFTVGVASAAGGVHARAARTAAEVIASIAKSSPGGEGNFRFAATANCPPGTPFFPAAWHQGEASFAIGLETPPLLLMAVNSHTAGTPLGSHIAATMDRALEPVQIEAEKIARTFGRTYLGIDASPAPGPDASIGQVLETIIGAPFGSISTLSACADITDGLKNLKVKTCGYSGLMLPVIEDTVLARRAAERRYGVQELLLYSSVCGTGLDVVPLPGNSTADTLALLIGDVAALSAKYHKPLSARLFPIPGKAAGEPVTFSNPFLTDSVIMNVNEEH